MLKIHLGETPNALTDDNYQVIADKTDGYAFTCREDIHEAAHIHTMLVLCSTDAPGPTFLSSFAKP